MELKVHLEVEECKSCFFQIPQKCLSNCDVGIIVIGSDFVTKVECNEKNSKPGADLTILC